MRTLSIGLVLFLVGLGAIPSFAGQASEPGSIRKTCGTCPEGYREMGSSFAPARYGSQARGATHAMSVGEDEAELS